jgi:hypothetical protein
MRNSVVPAHLQGIFQLKDAVAASLLGEKYVKKTEQVTVLQAWLESFREHSYHILGAASQSLQLYSIANLSQTLAQTVFSHLQSVENRHLKLFIHILYLFFFFSFVAVVALDSLAGKILFWKFCELLSKGTAGESGK